MSVGALALPAVAHFGYGIGFSPVLSQSMQPTFSAGDLEITHLVRASTVGVGDIVVLASPLGAGNYSHRVVAAMTRNGVVTFQTRGDANPLVDRNMVVSESSAQISKVFSTVPFAGFVVSFFASSAGRWLGIVLLAIAASLFLARLSIRKFVKHQPKESLI